MINRIVKFVRRFLKPHLSWLLISIATGIVAASASGMGIPLMIKFVFPVVFHQEGQPEPLLLQWVPQMRDLSHNTLLLLACGSMPLIFIIRGIAQWLNAVVVNVLGLRILEGLRTAVFHHVQQLPLAFLEGHRKGDIISRIVADTQNVQDVLSHISNDLVKQPITCVCALFAFIWLLIQAGSWQIFLVILFTGLLHAVSEMIVGLISLPFVVTPANGILFYLLITVGLGTFIHHCIDFAISLVILGALKSAKLISGNRKL